MHRTAPAARSAANVSSTCQVGFWASSTSGIERGQAASSPARRSSSRADLASIRNRTAPSRSPKPGSVSVSHGTDSAAEP